MVLPAAMALNDAGVGGGARLPGSGLAAREVTCELKPCVSRSESETCSEATPLASADDNY